MPMRTLLLNRVMEYTNPLLGLTSSRIAYPVTSAEPSRVVPMPVESSMPAPAPPPPTPAKSSVVPAPAPLDSIESQSQGEISNSSTPLQPGTVAAEALGGPSATSHQEIWESQI